MGKNQTTAVSSGNKVVGPKSIVQWKHIQETILDICATVPVRGVIAGGIVAKEKAHSMAPTPIWQDRACR